MNAYEDKPNLWLRFVDDIFVMWNFVSIFGNNPKTETFYLSARNFTIQIFKNILPVKKEFRIFINFIML